MMMCAEAISPSLQMEFISGSRWDLRVDIKLLKVRFYFNCLLGEEFQFFKMERKISKTVKLFSAILSSWPLSF